MIRFVSLFAAAALGLAGAAQAYTAQFTITGPTPLDSFSFTVPTDPVPGDVSAHSFTLFDVPSNGDIGFGPIDFLANYTFYDASFGGGFAGGYSLNTYSGSQLFSGTTAAPHFSRQGFTLTDFFGQSIQVFDAANVPEPASWALLVAGFGLVGAVMRRRAAVAA